MSHAELCHKRKTQLHIKIKSSKTVPQEQEALVSVFSFQQLESEVHLKICHSKLF